MVQYFFVSGAPKSGTTWVQRLLDAHPQVVCSGEGHFVERLAQPLVKALEDYAKQQQLVAERVYEGRPYYQPLTRPEMIGFARALIVQRMHARAGAGVKAVGDKTPRYTQFLGGLLALFPDARFINVIRHPYDVAVSLLHHGLRVGMADADTPGSEAYLNLVRNSAAQWSASQKAAAEFRARHPRRMLHLRYEDLLERPRELAAEMFAHLGVPANEAVVAHAVDASSFEKLSGRKPGEEARLSFFRKGVAGDWKDRLDEQALALIDSICGDQLPSEGYLSSKEQAQAGV
ncbi:MAG TPA: sulfotransferase [Caulobacteraceae bacterium]|jgi:hypothetical protein